MTRRRKWTVAILVAQLPLSFLAVWWRGPWALLPVLLVCNGARVFWAESLTDPRPSGPVREEP